MTRYFVKRVSTYTHKDPKRPSVMRDLKSMERMVLVGDDALTTLRRYVEAVVEEANRRYPDTTPWEVSSMLEGKMVSVYPKRRNHRESMADEVILVHVVPIIADLTAADLTAQIRSITKMSKGGGEHD